jgi:hypothetical protein
MVVVVLQTMMVVSKSQLGPVAFKVHPTFILSGNAVYCSTEIRLRLKAKNISVQKNCLKRFKYSCCPFSFHACPPGVCHAQLLAHKQLPKEWMRRRRRRQSFRVSEENGGSSSSFEKGSVKLPPDPKGNGSRRSLSSNEATDDIDIRYLQYPKA